MGKRSVSSSIIPTSPDQESLDVTVKNFNKEQKRIINLNVYDKDSEKKEMLPVYLNEEQITKDTMEPLEEKSYKIDVSNVKRGVVFKIIQEDGGSGMKMRIENSSSRPSKVEFQIK